MFEILSDNLNALMKEIRISADELGRRTGLPASTIKKIRNRYNPNPTLTTLLPLAKFFSVTLGQLTGNEPLPVKRVKGLYRELSQLVHHVPLLSWDEVLLWPATSNVTHPKIATEFQHGENAYALMVDEDNWENLAKGTTLLIDPTLKVEHRDFAIVHKTGQKIPSLKQVLFDENQMYLKPVIQGYNMIEFSAEHTILGIVVEYKKLLRKIPKQDQLQESTNNA